MRVVKKNQGDPRTASSFPQMTQDAVRVWFPNQDRTPLPRYVRLEDFGQCLRSHSRCIPLLISAVPFVSLRCLTENSALSARWSLGK